MSVEEFRMLSGIWLCAGHVLIGDSGILATHTIGQFSFGAQCMHDVASEELNALHEPFVAMAGGKKALKAWRKARNKGKPKNKGRKDKKGRHATDSAANDIGSQAQGAGFNTEVVAGYYPADMMANTPDDWVPHHLIEADRRWAAELARQQEE